jgi:hypothetical protein
VIVMVGWLAAGSGKDTSEPLGMDRNGEWLAGRSITRSACTAIRRCRHTGMVRSLVQTT